MFVRFVKRKNGKLDGPYMYESIRDGDKVISKYIGKFTQDFHSVTIKPLQPLQKRSVNEQKLFQGVEEKEQLMVGLGDRRILKKKKKN